MRSYINTHIYHTWPDDVIPFVFVFFLYHCFTHDYFTGIPVMNMIGSTRHVKKALDVGVDIICAQGGEGGGHTGDTATTVLIPQVVDLCKGKVAPINGQPVQVVAAGGIFDGRGLAMVSFIN